MPELEILSESMEPFGSGVPRSGGLHLTDVLNKIEQEMNWTKNEWQPEQLRWAGELGFIWEDLLSFIFAERMAIRVGEVECDGIIGSPDGLGFDPEYEDRMVLEEYKCTWVSAKRMPVDKWRYMAQIMSYLHMLDLDVCIMRILYIWGYWNGEGPVPRTCRIRFTKDEIEDNWAMILKYAEELR
jgi:hypothetical protein